MTESANEKSNHKARVTWRLVVFALFMFGFGYALVPLYDVLCN
jgi:cytochrome c oxidase assembly protein Cox11